MASENDVQRLFLQAIISRRVVPKKLAQIIWAQSIEAVNSANELLHIARNGDAAAWTDFVGQINKSIDRLDLEFRNVHDEATGIEMYILVNRKGDEIAQLASDYSALEIAFFKAIVEQIMLAPNESFSVSSLAALREVNTLKSSSMTKTQAEVVLGSFVAKGWLLKSSRGRYSLATRTVVELGPYLKSTYPEEVIECTICMEILTRGISCFTPNCKTRMHTHCFRKFTQRRTACPACSKDWPQAIEAPLVSVGENAVQNGQDDARRGIRKKDLAESQGGSQDQEMDEDEDEPSQSTRRQAKKEKKKVRMVGVGNEDDDDAARRPLRRSRR